MAKVKGTVNSQVCLVDDSAPTVPLTDAVGDGGDILAAAAATLANKKVALCTDLEAAEDAALSALQPGDELLGTDSLNINSDLELTHLGKWIVTDGTFTLTINSQATTAYTDNFECLVRVNSGILTINGENASGAPLINGEATNTVRTGGGIVVIKREVEDEWTVTPRQSQAVSVMAFGPGDTVISGNGAAGFAYRVPPTLDNTVLSYVAAHCETAGNGNTVIQIRNATAAVDMLSTSITLGSGEVDSTENAAQPVINTSNDVVSAGDKIYFDFDSVPGTPPEVIIVTMEFS